MIEPASANNRILRRMLVIAVAMFGFGFALVPFYKKICEIAGVNNILSADAPLSNSQVDLGRTVTIEFDANTRNLPWSFKPVKNSIQVHPGEVAHIEYKVSNTKDTDITGQAIPSFGPIYAGRYFKKMQCFCFTTQTLHAGETRVMPVVFVVDPQLPAEANTITLSYTFFPVEGRNPAGGG